MGKRKLTSLFVIVLFALAVLNAACGTTDTKPFVPAPPPVGAKYIMNLQQVVIGDNAQIMNFNSADIGISYLENNEGAGKTATEILSLNQDRATMTQITWGDWENAALILNEYFGSHKELVRAMVTLEFEKASIFQLFTGRGRYTVDRSYLILIYEARTPGAWPTLVEASYTELWGVGGNAVLLGATAVWVENLEDLLPNYSHWGFWEVNAYTAEIVKGALENVVANKLAGIIPNYEAIDQDSPRELIGRQTGFHLYKDGLPAGRINLEYGEALGRMPNTPLIGKGALTRVEWHFNDQYYALIALTPALSPVGQTLYIFVDNPVTADELSGKNPVKLYPKLRTDEIPHVLLATYAMGDIGSISARVVGGEGGKVDIGDQGGVQFRTLGNPTYENVAIASNLLAMLGKNGQKGVGFYYAYKSGSGSGLVYYLAALQLILADPDRVLNEPWLDVGVLDTVTIPNLGIKPFVD